MAEGAERTRWNHTADLMALMANCRPFARRGKTFRRSDFHPLLASPGAGAPLPAPISILKMFLPSETRNTE